jgi:hypothetical protein
MLSDAERIAIEDDPHYETEEVVCTPSCGHCGSTRFETIYHVTQVNESHVHTDASHNEPGDETVYVRFDDEEPWATIETIVREHQSTHCADCGEPYEGAIQEV